MTNATIDLDLSALTTSKWCPNTRYLDEGVEWHLFGVSDRLGREIGASVAYKLVVTTSDTNREWDRSQRRNLPAGTYFAWYAKAARGGKSYGPLQDWHYEATEEARAAAVEKYLAGAKKRAEKTAKA
jgi:hypothetical protein